MCCKRIASPTSTLFIDALFWILLVAALGDDKWIVGFPTDESPHFSYTNPAFSVGIFTGFKDERRVDVPGLGCVDKSLPSGAFGEYGITSCSQGKEKGLCRLSQAPEYCPKTCNFCPDNYNDNYNESKEVAAKFASKEVAYLPAKSDANTGKAMLILAALMVPVASFVTFRELRGQPIGNERSKHIRLGLTFFILFFTLIGVHACFKNWWKFITTPKSCTTGTCSPSEGLQVAVVPGSAWIINYLGTFLYTILFFAQLCTVDRTVDLMGGDRRPVQAAMVESSLDESKA